MHFCGVPSEFSGSAQGRLCKWPDGHVISVGLRQYVPGLSRDAQNLVHLAAWKAWRSVADCKYIFVGTDEFANIDIFATDLGGPLGVLASALLPCGGVSSTTALWQRYDTSELWSEVVPVPAGKIDLLAVVVHETGHSLGLPHGPVGNIMAASYTGSRELGEWDAAEARRRYGDIIPVLPDLTLIGVLRSARQFLDDLLNNA